MILADLRSCPPYPLGPHVDGDGVRFAVVSTAERVLLVLDPGGGERRELELDPEAHRTGEVWHVRVTGLRPPVTYAWRVARAGEVWSADLLDPYATEVGGWPAWGGGEAGARRDGWSVLTAGGCERPEPIRDVPGHPVDRVIYELSVRGFTADPSSGVAAAGTFRGLVEALPHVRGLGVTTLELLPIAAWNECEIGRRSPPTGESLRNLWGYSPVALLAPHPGLSAGGTAEPGATTAELSELVESCHRQGIEVFLDVVYNHTGEGELGEASPVYSLAGLARERYYRVDGAGRRVDFTGCGNTLDTADPVTQDLVLAALRHWVAAMGVDGFRFDLAAALTRGPDGGPEDVPAMVRRIDADPVVGSRALIAEAWDAGGLYRVGDFPRWGPWSEWNDRFRDGVRRFLRGDEGFGREMALRVAGSPDLYGGSPLGPGSSVNYVTSHDGFTLADLVSYERKRNLANGEENRDGTDASWSSGYGAEGPTLDPEVLAVRRRQVRSFLLTLFVSQGVPMLLAGDEMGNTQGGNNNAYCQDGPVGWVQWHAAADPHLTELVRRLIVFRRRHPTLRRRTYPEDGVFGSRSPFRWHAETGSSGGRLETARGLALELVPDGAPAPDVPLFLAWNPTSGPLRFELPAGRWSEAFDTAAEPPWRSGVEIEGAEIELSGRSIRVFEGESPGSGSPPSP